MVNRPTDQSPSPSLFGYSLGRRGFMKGAAGAAALGLALPRGIASAQASPATPSATGEVTLGSNYSDAVPKAALEADIAALPNKNLTVKVNTVDHNTFQENITTYLQNPDDVLTWFAGFRMRFFAAQGLVGDITDVWDAGLTDQVGAGFKVASTGDDGKMYFVPTSYYCWGIHYRKSLFEENSWKIPTTMDELTALATDMQGKGLIPFAFANDGRWPVMGTFDQLNFRMNGYQFHVDLMAGKEKWTDDKVKAVFAKWTELLPFHQPDANGRTWQEAAQAVVGKQAGMMTIGNFIGQQFPEADQPDLDFFPWPEMNPEFGAGTIEAPFDGFMMASKPKNEAGAKELLYHFGTAAGQEAYLSKDPSVVVPNNNADTSGYTPLQKKVFDAVSAAPNVTQFLDRDASPEFASNVAGPGLADFIADPTKIDSILSDMQTQAEAIYSE
ncbi:MAG TPA: ABC transporter substrate-binding protein [Thermomicrobiales bacterium]|nr:ABC transporter substrate-binding protein [Thermomicrobiales bacterium]